MIHVNDVQHRISAINQTRQITKAMHLISASKVKRDVAWVELTRTYFLRARSTMRDILENSRGIEHRYMIERTTKRAAYVVIAGDRGLCGDYNHRVLNFALEKMKSNDDVRIIAIGQLTGDFFTARGYSHIDTDFIHVCHHPHLRHARRIVDYIFGLFDNDEIDELYVVYTRYESSVKQTPHIMKLLPIMLSDFANVAHDKDYIGEMLYEPSPQEVFDTLVPEFAIGMLFGGLIQSYISEHTSRMNAMENATKNADEMIEKLTRQYNTARQYAITQEISEIVGAADVLNKLEEI